MRLVKLSPDIYVNSDQICYLRTHQLDKNRTAIGFHGGVVEEGGVYTNELIVNAPINVVRDLLLGK